MFGLLWCVRYRCGWSGCVCPSFHQSAGWILSATRTSHAAPIDSTKRSLLQNSILIAVSHENDEEMLSSDRKNVESKVELDRDRLVPRRLQDHEVSVASMAHSLVAAQKTETCPSIDVAKLGVGEGTVGDMDAIGHEGQEFSSTAVLDESRHNGLKADTRRSLPSASEHGVNGEDSFTEFTHGQEAFSDRIMHQLNRIICYVRDHSTDMSDKEAHEISVAYRILSLAKDGQENNTAVLENPKQSITNAITKLKNIVRRSSYQPKVFNQFLTILQIAPRFLLPEDETSHGGGEQEANRNDVLALVATDGYALKCASDKYQDDKQVVLSAVRQAGGALRYAAENLKSDKDVVLAAVKQDSWSLKFANDNMRNDREVVTMAVKDVGWTLSFASSAMQADQGIVKMAIEQDGIALKFASDKLKSDKDTVKTATFEKAFALTFASDELKCDKNFVKELVHQNGSILEFASDVLKADMDVVMAAVQENGLSLQYASDLLKADKQIVINAVKSNSEALKFALGGLNQDPDCWIAANLWHDGDVAKKELPDTVRVALSTKFDLSEQQKSSPVTRFTALLKSHPFFRSKFVVYSPNAFKKDTCDPEWTSMAWPCRGSFSSCRKDEALKIGPPNNESCWRYSYRYHLEEAHRTKGFMLQIVDYNVESKRHELGKGQRIESVMASIVGTKIFRVCQPVDTVAARFDPWHMSALVSKIDKWYTSGCKDLSGILVQFYRLSCTEEWSTFTRKFFPPALEVKSLRPKHLMARDSSESSAYQSSTDQSSGQSKAETSISMGGDEWRSAQFGAITKSKIVHGGDQPDDSSRQAPFPSSSSSSSSTIESFTVRSHSSVHSRRSIRHDSIHSAHSRQGSRCGSRSRHSSKSRRSSHSRSLSKSSRRRKGPRGRSPLREFPREILLARDPGTPSS